LFVGHSLLGFTTKEVGHMTLKTWSSLYKHFQNYYDFTLSKKSFYELKKMKEKSESLEWFDD